MSTIQFNHGLRIGCLDLFKTKCQVLHIWQGFPKATIQLLVKPHSFSIIHLCSAVRKEQTAYDFSSIKICLYQSSVSTVSTSIHSLRHPHNPPKNQSRYQQISHTGREHSYKQDKLGVGSTLDVLSKSD